MIISTYLALILSVMNPEPLLLQSTIDIARIIGLPRLKTMDKYLNRTVYINEMETRSVYLVDSRLDFLKHYLKLNSFKSS
jgi:hypothetical protein